MTTRIYSNLAGRTVVYTDKTVFVVQLCKRNRTAYRNLYETKGNFNKAVRAYLLLHLTPGEKKRIWSKDLVPRVIIKETT